MDPETIRLQDDRLLAFSQSGDLKGKPVFFFRGSPGSRLFRPPDQITQKHRVRLIAVDRPGFGQSSFQPKRKILDWSEDIRQLADKLNLGKFHVAGHSGGGPYVLACAIGLQERVISSAIISSIGPIEAVGKVAEISTINRLGLLYGKYIPWWVWKVLIYTKFHNRSVDPLKDIMRQEGNRPLADTLLLDDPRIRDNCVQSELEAFKPGILGLAWDVRLLTHSWDFNIEDIRSPIFIWHGSDDDQAPITMAKFMADKISSSLPRFLPDEGHLLLFKYWDAILDGLLAKLI